MYVAHRTLAVTSGGSLGKPCGMLAESTLADVKSLTADGICRKMVGRVEHLPAFIHRAVAVPADRFTCMCRHGGHALEMLYSSDLLVPTRVLRGP